MGPRHRPPLARVEVLERDRRAGGVPRHCAHGGFGTWTRPLTGPAYARLLVEAAVGAGATVRTGVTALDWPGPLSVTTVGPRGPGTLTARAVVLATGARERPRAARLVPGTRPAGVYTTGELQQAVHLHRQHIGDRAVVVGTQDVAYAAAATVRAAGAEVVAMVTESRHPRTSPARALGARHPVLTGTTVTEVLGHGRLSGVRIRHRDGRTGILRCDTMVFTGDFVPETELARRAALTLGPRTSRPGVFAAGGLLQPGVDARTAAREGVRVGRAVLEWLAHDAPPPPLTDP
ncbi:NAD(P)/FAD-dependent oxidoreductase [Streptomyces olivochromogenes]|nr:NAD(P)/FAD-dependent oxidoreductase [Streptomyces olivochromogenes]